MRPSQQQRAMEILVIDDSPSEVALLRLCWNETSPRHRLSSVNDGQQALDFLCRKGAYVSAPTPDLILLDLNMPRMNGFEALEAIKEDRRFRRIPVLIFSSSASQIDVDHAYDLHANGYLCKPSDLDAMCKLVEQVETFWFSLALAPDPVDVSRYQ